MNEQQKHRKRILAWAKRYCELNWPIVVLHGVTPDGDCTCSKGDDCKARGKHPVFPKWQDKASADWTVIRNQLRQQFKIHRSCNIGVRLGPTSGLVDVEFDDPEGRETANRLLKGIETPTYKSRRSVHRLFQFPDDLSINKAVVKCRGLEIRFGVGKRATQSVLPPSNHYSGKNYRWLEGFRPLCCDPAPFPDCLRELFAANSLKQPTSSIKKRTLASHPGEEEGQRHETLCELVGRHLRQNGVTDDLTQLAEEWAKRCKPPLPPKEVAKVVSDLSAKHKNEKHFSLKTRPYSEIEPEDIEWLWPERIALGKLTLIVGEPGVGKTFLTCDMMSRVSRGKEWPDGTSCQPAEALFITAEDDPNDTIRPRLDKHKADPERIHHMDCVEDENGRERHLSLKEHLRSVDEFLLANTEIELVVIDPISAFMGEVDSHNNTAVRQVLGPVAILAGKHKVSIVGITHLNKSQGKSINRVLGSIGFVAAARAAWQVSRDPEDNERRLMVPVKNNIGLSHGLAYTINDGRLEWDEGEVFLSADEIDAMGDQSKLGQAKQWLSDFLNKPTPSKEVKEAAEVEGFSKSTLRRAKGGLDVISRQHGGQWYWMLDTGRHLLFWRGIRDSDAQNP